MFINNWNKISETGLLRLVWKHNNVTTLCVKLILRGASCTPCTCALPVSMPCPLTGSKVSKAGGKAGVSSTATAWHAISLPSAYTKNKELLWAVPPTLNLIVHFPNCTWIAAVGTSQHLSYCVLPAPPARGHWAGGRKWEPTHWSHLLCVTKTCCNKTDLKRVIWKC